VQNFYSYLFKESRETTKVLFVESLGNVCTVLFTETHPLSKKDDCGNGCVYVAKKTEIEMRLTPP